MIIFPLFFPILNTTVLCNYLILINSISFSFCFSFQIDFSDVVDLFYYQKVSESIINYSFAIWWLTMWITQLSVKLHRIFEWIMIIRSSVCNTDLGFLWNDSNLIWNVSILFRWIVNDPPPCQAPQKSDDSEDVKDPFPTHVLGQESWDWERDHSSHVTAGKGDGGKTATLQGRCPSSPNGMDWRVSDALIKIHKRLVRWSKWKTLKK
jgi:hypothetical protein